MKLTILTTSALSVLAAPDLSAWKGKRLVRHTFDGMAEHVHFHQNDELLLDVWGHSKNTVDFVLDENNQGLLEKVDDLNITTIIPDLRAHFEEFFATEPVCDGGVAACVTGPSFKKGANSSIIDDIHYDQYQRFDTILAKMEAIEAESNGLVERFTFGESYEGRPLNGFKVTGTSGFGNGKKVAVYNCGTHAREWIPPAFCVYLVHNMAAEYGVDPTITALLDEFEVHTIPITNPDGYEFSHVSNNNWRKSRKPNAGATGARAVGTDLNRNFDFQWGTGGSSSLPTSDSYKGAEPFDNVESKALADYWNGLTNAVVQMDIHAYGGMWMYPMGYKSENLCPTEGTKRACGVESDADYNAHEICGQASKAAVEAVNGYEFRVGPIPYVIYQASGSTCDYAYAESGIRWAYALEVRGNTFQPPTSNIKLSNLELYEGVKAQLACIESTLTLEKQGISLPDMF